MTRVYKTLPPIYLRSGDFLDLSWNIEDLPGGTKGAEVKVTVKTKWQWLARFVTTVQLDVKEFGPAPVRGLALPTHPSARRHREG